MSFTYVLTNDTGKARLKLADTGGVAPGGTATSGYAFEDEEWAYFLSEAGSVDSAVGLAARSLLVDTARRVRAFSLPGVTYDDRGRVEALRAIVSMFGAEMPTATVRMPGPTAFDTGYLDPIPTLTTSSGS